MITTKGIKVPVGQTRRIEPQHFSDGPTTGPRTSTVTDPLALMSGTDSSMTFSTDRTSGQNGDIVKLTIMTTAPDPNMLGFGAFYVESKLGDTTNYWIGLVGF